MKYCNNCSLEKDIDEFNKNKKYADGLHYCCKECKKISSKKYYENNKEKVKSDVKKYRVNNLDDCKKRVKNYHTKNKNEIKIYKKEYSIKNKEEIKIKQHYYYIVNKAHRRDWSREYIRKRKKEDPIFLFKTKVSDLIGQSIKRRGYKKDCRSTEILGCTILEFKEYLESKFLEGMSWENHGEWHMDHIIPISYAKSEEEVLKLNHYTNFQPLWANDNIKKGNRWIG